MLSKKQAACIFFPSIFMMDTTVDGPIFPPLSPSSQLQLPLPSGHRHTVVYGCGQKCIYKILRKRSDSNVANSQATLRLVYIIEKKQNKTGR